MRIEDPCLNKAALARLLDCETSLPPPPTHPPPLLLYVYVPSSTSTSLVHSTYNTYKSGPLAYVGLRANRGGGRPPLDAALCVSS